MDISKVKKQAQIEIYEEDFAEAVEDYKIKIRTRKSFFDKIFPWKILIVRK